VTNIILPAPLPRAGEIVALGDHKYGRITERLVETTDRGYRYTLDVELLPDEPNRVAWSFEPTDC
jgi:hypothetical protein